MDEPLFWPFPNVVPEAAWSEFDRDFIDLMRVAFAEGYRPRTELCGDAALGPSPDGRSATLVRRGSRNGWEPFLVASDNAFRLGPHYGLPLGEYACVCVRPPFRGAAHLALEWMRGRSLESLLDDFEFLGGHPTGIVLRPEVVPAVSVRSGPDGGRNA